MKIQNKRKGEKMKKIKELWSNNRVLLVLAGIILICCIIMLVVCYKFFFGASTSSYGDRLETIENLPLKEEDKAAIINKLNENETVKNVDVYTNGKIIKIRIEYENVSIERAKEIAGTTLEVINEEYQKNYDIQYTIITPQKENDPGFTLMGAKNINRSTIIWNNNTPIQKD